MGKEIVTVFKGPRKWDALSTNTNPCHEAGQDSANELHVGKLQSGHGRRLNVGTQTRGQLTLSDNLQAATSAHKVQHPPSIQTP